MEGYANTGAPRGLYQRGDTPRMEIVDLVPVTEEYGVQKICHNMQRHYPYCAAKIPVFYKTTKYGSHIFSCAAFKQVPDIYANALQNWILSLSVLFEAAADHCSENRILHRSYSQNFISLQSIGARHCIIHQKAGGSAGVPQQRRCQGKRRRQKTRHKAEKKRAAAIVAARSYAAWRRYACCSSYPVARARHISRKTHMPTSAMAIISRKT